MVPLVPLDLKEMMEHLELVVLMAITAHQEKMVRMDFAGRSYPC